MSRNLSFLSMGDGRIFKMNLLVALIVIRIKGHCRPPLYNSLFIITSDIMLTPVIIIQKSSMNNETCIDKAIEMLLPVADIQLNSLAKFHTFG